MLVENWMNRNVVTVDAEDSMLDAMKLLKEKNIRRLPVLRKGKLVGIVTDRDLKKASPSEATTLEAHELLYLTAKITVKEIMTPNPVTVPFNYTVEEAAAILLDRKISGLPVVDKDGAVVGTITQTDIFRVLISVTGFGKEAIQFAFSLEDRPGSIKEVADIVRKYKGRMASILSSFEGAPEGFRTVYIRAYGLDRERLADLKKELKGAAKLLYVIDHKENKREIFVG
ncbi:MAG: CBS and ACT domain-containing protein [Desulfobacterales bacterium]|nr:CBS and ACT domain-containing protein [Desulfobacterales bacterium]